MREAGWRGARSGPGHGGAWPPSRSHPLAGEPGCPGRSHDSAGPPAPEQLGKVVDGADEMPLGGDLDPAPEVEPPEPAGLLGLAEDRLDDRLAPPVLGPALLGGE